MEWKHFTDAGGDGRWAACCVCRLKVCGVEWMDHLLNVSWYRWGKGNSSGTQKAGQRPRQKKKKKEEKSFCTEPFFLNWTRLQGFKNRRRHWGLVTDFRSCQIKFEDWGRERKHNTHRWERRLLGCRLNVTCVHTQTFREVYKADKWRICCVTIPCFTVIQMLMRNLSK